MTFMICITKLFQKFIPNVLERVYVHQFLFHWPRLQIEQNNKEIEYNFDSAIQLLR